MAFNGLSSGICPQPYKLQPWCDRSCNGFRQVIGVGMGMEVGGKPKACGIGIEKWIEVAAWGPNRVADSQTVRQSDPNSRQSDTQTVRPEKQTVRHSDSHTRQADSQTVRPGMQTVRQSDCLPARSECLTV